MLTSYVWTLEYSIKWEETALDWEPLKDFLAFYSNSLLYFLVELFQLFLLPNFEYHYKVIIHLSINYYYYNTQKSY